MPANKFKIEILGDGMLSINSDDFSPEVHKEADEMIVYLGKLMGGDVVVKEKHSHAKHHHHGHGHNHQHHNH